MCYSGRPMTGNSDRIQKLRKEYYQARREGFPLYEDEEGRTGPCDHDLRWPNATRASITEAAAKPEQHMRKTCFLQLFNPLLVMCPVNT
ncbi:hypothetical protein ACRRTK_000026 [Alexandromys fortis]